MKLKKFMFDYDEYDHSAMIVFAEDEKEALEIINKKKWGEDEDFKKYYYSLDDFEIEELEIQQPEKAYKGCYEYSFFW